MKRVINYSIAVLFVALMTGCASSVQPKQVAQIKSVGIVSVLDDNLIAHEDGLTKFGTYDDLVDISTWDVNTYITNMLKKRLEKRFKTTVINKNDKNMLLWKEEAYLDSKKDHIKAIMREKKLDTIIVVKKGFNSNWPAHDALNVTRTKVVFLPSLHSVSILLEPFFYQNVNGELQLTQSNLLIGAERLDDRFWNVEKRTVNVQKLNELENIFKRQLYKVVQDYMNSNNL